MSCPGASRNQSKKNILAELGSDPMPRPRPYAIIAREDRLPWSTLVDAFEVAGAALDPGPRRVRRRGVGSRRLAL